MAREYPVFRVDNLEVLDLLNLKRRPGSFRYSYNEVTGGENLAEIDRQSRLAFDVPEERRSVFQNKVVELFVKLNTFHSLSNAFGAPPLSGEPSKVVEEMAMSLGRAASMRSRQAPRCVPPSNPDGPWLTLFEAYTHDYLQRLPQTFQQQVITQLASGAPRIREDLLKLFDDRAKAGATPAAPIIGKLLDAYADGDDGAFNEQLALLKAELEDHQADLVDPANAEAVADLIPAERTDLGKSGFEAYFNEFSPFFLCWVSYIVAFVLCAASWLGWPRTLGRAATAVILVTFLLHTFAVLSRIYISGRPPVTNLYSSAVFIGWAIVLAGLAFEAIFRMGIGSVLASSFGFLTLVMAHNMAADGDTFTVLQAVLDTQFWLATHVVCITFGYAATYVAGGLAIVYLIRSHILGNLEASGEKALPRMIYGTLCFAIFFSFIGTVLGGLWGDNSWGRFWGWDPKENGALIIVLWNALVLHARWGKMVGPSGLAALAVAGNICTTWSWFGVNEMGVGLHAYGGLSDSVSLELFALRAVVFTHPLIIAAAMIPRRNWRALIYGAPPATA